MCVCVCACVRACVRIAIEAHVHILNPTDGGFGHCSNLVECGDDNIGIACTVPQMKSGLTASVNLVWNGASQKDLAFLGAKGTNKM